MRQTLYKIYEIKHTIWWLTTHTQTNTSRTKKEEYKKEDSLTDTYKVLQKESNGPDIKNWQPITLSKTLKTAHSSGDSALF